MKLDKNITRTEFNARLEAATQRRSQNADAMEARNARILDMITGIESALDEKREEPTRVSNAALREKRERLSAAAARFAQTL